MKNLNILNTMSIINQIDLSDANVKTALWIAKIVRVCKPVQDAFEALRTQLTSTDIFRKYQSEYQAADSDDAKAEINAKYKEVLEDADNELKVFAEKEIEEIIWPKIKDADIEGITGKWIPALLDMIDIAD